MKHILPPLCRAKVWKPKGSPFWSVVVRVAGIPIAESRFGSWEPAMFFALRKTGQ